MSCFSFSVDSMHMTSAYSLSNSFPLILCLFKFIKHSKLSIEEYLGVFISLLGITLIISSQEEILWKSLIALLGGVFASIYFQISSLIKDNYYPWIVAITMISFFSSIFLTIFTLILESATLSFSPINGIFGYLSSEWILLYSFICIITSVSVTFLYQFLSDRINNFFFDIMVGIETAVAVYLVYLLDF
jgi:hypothetical protein